MKNRKTALVLSGGGSRGAYQCGVWQALTELGIKIDIVVGVSVGAINGSMVVQGDVAKTANLWREMETDMVFDVEPDISLAEFAKEMLKNQGVGSTGLQKMLSEYVDEDVVRNSPIDFGLSVVELPSFKPHFFWKEDIPKGQINDFITASASAFPAIHTHKIGNKVYADGGYEDVCPAYKALEKGATEVIAVYLAALGRYRPERMEQVPNLRVIQSKWDLGDVFTFDTLRSKRLLRLGYLDAMKSYDIFDGEYYTFVKGEFEPEELKLADHAGHLFQVDPLILYRKELFMENLASAVQQARLDMNELEGLDIINEFPDFTPAKIRTLLKKVNKKTATLFIAENICEKGADSLFLTKSVSMLFEEEVQTAKYLIGTGLLQNFCAI